MTLKVQKVIYTVKRPKSALSDAALFQKENLPLSYHSIMWLKLVCLAFILPKFSDQF